MRVLLLAYACEPNRGSEPGVGWNWAINLAEDKSKDVFVLTRSNNKDVINNYWKENIIPSNLHFFFYDMPAILVWGKHHGLPINIYYSLWLQGCLKMIKRLHQEFHFELIHHITFGVFRNVCPLYKLNIPYVFGPIGGGEYTPSGMMRLYTSKEISKERLRYFANKLALLNPIVHKTMKHAALVLAKTKETKSVLSKWKDKVTVSLEIGIKEVVDDSLDRDKDLFLFVGRFIYWKGVKLVLQAFKTYQESHPSAKMLFVGKGDMSDYIKQYSNENGLTGSITIIPWIAQEELKQYYMKSCAMIFPSLHDSSGNVVLEAISHGLPVISLDCGGPASILGENLPELIVPTGDLSVNEVSDNLAKKMEILSSASIMYKEISNKCLARAKQMLWQNNISNTYKLIEDTIQSK